MICASLALVDAPSDYFAGGYYGINPPKEGIIGGKPWRAVGSHPITDGVPLELWRPIRLKS